MHNYVSTIRRYTYVPLIPRLWNHSYLKDELYYYYVRVVYVHVREGRFQYNNVLHSQGRKWEPASNREHLCTHSSVSTIDVDLRTYARVESLQEGTRAIVNMSVRTGTPTVRTNWELKHTSMWSNLKTLTKYL